MRQALISALLLSAIAMPVSVHACSCRCENRGVNDPKEMMREAKAVFAGEVTDIREATPEERRHHSDEFVVSLRVERAWKGVKEKDILVSARGQLQPGCCDIALKIGEKYLVYAVGKSMSTSCARTRLLAQADEDLKALGSGKGIAK
jgi:hypothetical protein